MKGLLLRAFVTSSLWYGAEKADTADGERKKREE
jgi:hypothetical protein